MFNNSQYYGHYNAAVLELALNDTMFASAIITIEISYDSISTQWAFTVQNLKIFNNWSKLLKTDLAFWIEKRLFFVLF